MYFLLILFFASLLGITFMVERKLLMLQNGHILHRSDFFLKTPHVEEWKNITIKKLKKHGYVVLVTTIRFYIRSSNIVKTNYQEIKTRIKNLRARNKNGGLEEKREVNKFLKMISEYKEKIREIKHKIKEEEENLQ